jgi:hypothetical protein
MIRTTNLDLNLATGNIAFEENPHLETARILRALADAIESEKEGPFTLRDISGNAVGRAFFETWEEEEEGEE